MAECASSGKSFQISDHICYCIPVLCEERRKMYFGSCHKVFVRFYLFILFIYLFIYLLFFFVV